MSRHFSSFLVENRHIVTIPDEVRTTPGMAAPAGRSAAPRAPRHVRQCCDLLCFVAVLPLRGAAARWCQGQHGQQRSAKGQRPPNKTTGPARTCLSRGAVHVAKYMFFMYFRAPVRSDAHRSGARRSTVNLSFLSRCSRAGRAEQHRPPFLEIYSIRPRVVKNKSRTTHRAGVTGQERGVRAKLLRQYLVDDFGSRSRNSRRTQNCLLYVCTVHCGTNDSGLPRRLVGAFL